MNKTLLIGLGVAAAAILYIMAKNKTAAATSPAQITNANTPASWNVSGPPWPQVSALPQDAQGLGSVPGPNGSTLNLYQSASMGYFQVNTTNKAIKRISPAHYQAIVSQIGA